MSLTEKYTKKLFCCQWQNRHYLKFMHSPVHLQQVGSQLLSTLNNNANMPIGTARVLVCWLSAKAAKRDVWLTGHDKTLKSETVPPKTRCTGMVPVKPTHKLICNPVWKNWQGTVLLPVLKRLNGPGACTPYNTDTDTSTSALVPSLKLC